MRTGINAAQLAGQTLDGVRAPLASQIDALSTRLAALEQEVAALKAPWRVDAVIRGVLPNMSLVMVQDYDVPAARIEGDGLMLDVLPGSIDAQIPCGNIEQPSGDQCNGNEAVGVAFVTATPGAVEACVAFSHFFDLNGTFDAAEVRTSFVIVETPSAPSTTQQIDAIGQSAAISYFRSDNSDNQAQHPIRLCSTFRFATPGRRILRLRYAQPIATGVQDNRIVEDGIPEGSGAAAIAWSVRPLTME